MSLFHSDQKQEKILSGYLDSYYYPNLYETYKRVSNRDEQFKGADVVVHRGNREIVIDEKAQLHYINKNLPTFAFEISYNKDGQSREGWLIDSNKVTTQYVLIWVWADEDYLENSNQIDKLELLHIPRKTIINYLKQEGFNQDKLIRISNKIKSNDVKGKYTVGHGNIYFYRTTHLSEKPVNIVIRKNILKKLSIAVHNIP